MARQAHFNRLLSTLAALAAVATPSAARSQDAVVIDAPVLAPIGVSVPTSDFASGYHAPNPPRVPARGDLIGPLGNQARPSYRRSRNRPRFSVGKIASHIAPSSQEAMAWREADRRGDYDCDASRRVATYFHPKPWEVLPVGPRERIAPKDTDNADDEFQPVSRKLIPRVPIVDVEKLAVTGEMPKPNSDDVRMDLPAAVLNAPEAEKHPHAAIAMHSVRRVTPPQPDSHATSRSPSVTRRSVLKIASPPRVITR